MAGRPGWINLIFFYLSAGGIVLLITLIPASAENPLWKSIRITYPLFLIIFFYRALSPQFFLINSSPLDSAVHAFEMSVLGFDPAFILQPYMEIWINELMSLGYLSYYFLIPLAAAAFIYHKKWETLERLTFGVIFTFYLSYILFIIFPVVGPRFYLENSYYLPIIGPFFTPFTQYVVMKGGHFGAAMPSTHCAVALVIIWITGKEYGKTTMPGILLLILLCGSTVWGRYHYLSDVVTGLLTGTFGLLVTFRIHKTCLAGGNRLLSGAGAPREPVDSAVSEN